MIRRPPRSTHCISSAASDVYKRQTGDAVNLECDILAKYVERLLDARHEPAASRVLMERLIREGF